MDTGGDRADNAGAAPEDCGDPPRRGKLPGLDCEEKAGWEEIRRVLNGRPRPAPSFFAREPGVPEWATANLRGVHVERLPHFGDVYLGLMLCCRLGLVEFCSAQIPEGREDVPWPVMVAVLVLARFCAPSSELQIAESWYGKTALDELPGIPAEKINEDRLYRSLDKLLPHKDALCRPAVAGSNATARSSGPRSTF